MDDQCLRDFPTLSHCPLSHWLPRCHAATQSDFTAGAELLQHTHAMNAANNQNHDDDNDDVDDLAANLGMMGVGVVHEQEQHPLSVEEERDPSFLAAMVDKKSRKGLHHVYSNHNECLTCRLLFGTRKDFNKHLKKRKHYQGQKLQGDIAEFIEDMEEKYNVDLHEVPLTGIIDVVDLDVHEQQNVRRLQLDRAKLKHF